LIAFDTNVLLYAVDTTAGAKHATASLLLERALARGDLLLPLQVLAEFHNSLVRKFRRPARDAAGFVEDWSAFAKVEAYALPDVRVAMQAHQEHGIPTWDAIIWAVCDRAGAKFLVTEDFQNERRLGRVMFLNPFAPANAGRLGLDGA
jgi:predicted nucleic acid-binding protein